MYQEQETLFRIRSQVRIIIPNENRQYSYSDLQIRAELPYASALALLDSPALYDQVKQDHAQFPEFDPENYITYSVDFPSSIVTFIVTYSNQEDARSILKSTVQTYIKLLETQAKEEVTRNVKIMDNLVRDLSEKVSEKERSLLERQAQMTALGNGGGVQGNLQRVNSEIMGLQVRIPKLEREVDDAKAVKKALESEISEIQSRIQTKDIPPSMLDSPAITAARSSVFRLESELMLLLQRYTEQHELVIQAQTKLDQEKKQLNDHLERAGEEILVQLAKDSKIFEEELRIATRTLDSLEAILLRHNTTLDHLVKNHSEMRRSEQELKNDQQRLQNYQGILSTLQIHDTYRRQYADTLIDPAKAGVQTVGAISPQHYLITILTGILFGMVFAYIMELADSRIKTEYEVKRYLNLPVLAELPFLARRDEKIISRVEPGSIFMESFNSLAVVLENSYVHQGESIFMVTSGDKEEGKTTISSNLAISLAWSGKKTLLLDGDLRVGGQASLHGLKRKGLSDLLSLSAEQGNLLHFEDFIQQHPDVKSLDVMTSGPTVSNPISLFKGPYFKILIEKLKEIYEVIIIDSPPLSVAADGLVLGTQANRTLLVSSTMESDRRVLRECKNRLDHARLNVAGVILNKVVPPPFAKYSYYKYRYYHRSNE